MDIVFRKQISRLGNLITFEKNEIHQLNFYFLIKMEADKIYLDILVSDQYKDYKEVVIINLGRSSERNIIFQAIKEEWVNVQNKSSIHDTGERAP